jgi:hypothetical protein
MGMLDHLKGFSPHLVASFAFGGILLLILFVLCFQFTPVQGDHGHTVSINIAIFAAGWASGWVAGTLVAPYDKDEATLFSQISRGIWAFISGYLLAKLDPIFGSLRESGVLPLTDLSAFRIIVYFTVAIIIMLIVFFARKYGKWHLPPGDTERSGPRAKAHGSGR